MSVLTKISDSFIYLANKIKQLENGGSSGIHYELNKEIKTNDIWIDGKPIYLWGTSSTISVIGSNYYIDLPNLNINKALEQFGHLSFKFPIYFSSNNYDEVWYISPTSSTHLSDYGALAVLHTSSARKNSLEYLFIKYTKK